MKKIAAEGLHLEKSFRQPLESEKLIFNSTIDWCINEQRAAGKMNYCEPPKP
jgi:hypothetical protein